MLAGSLAGVTACIVTYPADLTRARMAVTTKHELVKLNVEFIFINVTQYIIDTALWFKCLK